MRNYHLDLAVHSPSQTRCTSLSVITFDYDFGSDGMLAGSRWMEVGM